MYGPRGMNRSGFGAFTAAKRAEQAAQDAAAQNAAGDEATVTTPVSTPDAARPVAPVDSAGSDPTTERS